MGPGGGGIGDTATCCILSPFLGLIHLHRLIRTCASNIAGADPSRPIAYGGAYPATRGQMSPYPNQAFCLLNFPMECNVAHTSTTELVQASLGRIGL